MGIQIHELATKSGNLSSSDYLVTDNGTVTAKIDYTKLAKAIVEQYNGSTLAGSAQTLQSALNKLAPLLEQSWMTFSNTALLTTQAEALARGHYFGICNTYQHQTETGAPLNNANSYIEVYVQSSSWIGIKLSPISNIGSIYYKTKNNGTWTEWTHTIAS